MVVSRLRCRWVRGKAPGTPSLQQAAVGQRGSRATQNHLHSGDELLKDSASIEGQINVTVVLPSRFVYRAACGCRWKPRREWLCVVQGRPSHITGIR